MDLILQDLNTLSERAACCLQVWLSDLPGSKTKLQRPAWLKSPSGERTIRAFVPLLSRPGIILAAFSSTAKAKLQLPGAEFPFP